MFHLVLVIVASEGLKVHLELALWAFTKWFPHAIKLYDSFHTFHFVIVFYIEDNVRFRCGGKATEKF